MSEKGKDIFLIFEFFYDEREKHKIDTKHRNYESKQLMHARTL